MQMLVIIFCVFLTYAFLVRALTTGWVKAIEQNSPASSNTEFISVLVPVRNEEKNIALILNDLFAQNYPANGYEVLVINDHSEDGTIRVVEEQLKSTSFSNITIVQSASKGKKAAITEGVKLAKGKIIITTDADCRVGINWLRSFNSYFIDASIKMVFGPVKIIAAESFFEKMQAIEFASLIGSGAATMSKGMPTMCNGANLAFRKDVFLEVNGYESNLHIASGDDEFLMRKIDATYPKSIRFNNAKESIIATQAQKTLTEFLTQRLRWAGKWKFHHDLKSKFLALYVFMFHLGVLVLPVLAFTGYIPVSFMVVLFLIKAMLEYQFLVRITSWLQIRWQWPAFILLQLTYSLYAVLVGVLATFIKPVWKGRSI